MARMIKTRNYRSVVPRPQRLAAAILLAATLISLPNSAEADVTVEASQTDTGQYLMVYKLTVTPAAEPVPAFKYRLTVPPDQTVPGNAATHYLRSDGEQSFSHPWKRATDEFGFGFPDWARCETSNTVLPVEKLRQVAGYFDSFVDGYIRHATICRECDWGLAEEDLQGENVVILRLPSAQQSRSISRVLALQTRLAVVDGRYEDAIEYLRMNYQLGQNVSKMKFLVTGLIGLAEVGIANDGLIALIAAPDSPNMYWAIAEIPNPVIAMRDAMRLESSITKRFIPELDHPESTEHSSEQWARVCLNAIRSSDHSDFGYVNRLAPSETKLVAMSLLSGLGNYSSAKKRLIASGMDAARVEEMAVGQVLMTDASRDVQRVADEFEKAFYLPYQDTRKQYHTAEAFLQTLYYDFRLGGILAVRLHPAVQQVQAAAVRTQGGLNVLQAIEAIRMHLDSTGTLPATLDEIAVPVPLNPMTGEPFLYRLEGNTAIIDLPYSDGVAFAQRFEIRVASDRTGN